MRQLVRLTSMRKEVSDGTIRGTIQESKKNKLWFFTTSRSILPQFLEVKKRSSAH